MNKFFVLFLSMFLFCTVNAAEKQVKKAKKSQKTQKVEKSFQCKGDYKAVSCSDVKAAKRDFFCFKGKVNPKKKARICKKAKKSKAVAMSKKQLKKNKKLKKNTKQNKSDKKGA